MKRLNALIVLAGLCAGIPAASANDQDYPNRPIKLIQPSAPGGPSDVVIRPIADALSARLGQPVVVENKPGAGGVIGIDSVAKSPADGYTLLSVGNFLFTTAALRQKMPYDAIKDFTGISLLSRGPAIVLVANPDFKPNTIAEVVEYAKTQPDGLTYTSPNFGGVPFLSGQLLVRVAGVKLQHVTYTGSPAALIDVMAGRVPLMFDIWSSSKQHVEAGKLKVIAVIGTEKLPEAPQYPLMMDTYPAFNFNVNQALIVAAQTPPAIVNKLTSEIHAIVATPEIQQRMRTYGVWPSTSTSEEYNKLAESELAKWTEVARANNLTLQ